MNKTSKLIIWHGVVAVLVWKLWSYGEYVTQNFPINIGGIDFEGISIINFIVLVVVVALGIILLQKKIWTLTLTGIVVLFYLFQFGFTYLNLLGSALAILLSFQARASGLEEIRERTKVNSKNILRSTVSWFIIGQFILVSFAVYQSPNVQNLKNIDKLPSESEKFTRTIVEKFVGGRIEAKNEKEKQMLVTQVSNEAPRQLSGFLKPYFKYSPPVLAFGLFLVLLGLSWFFIWTSVGVGMFVFWILKKTGFVKIEEKDVKAEVLVI